jgi:hypothetical protein
LWTEGSRTGVTQREIHFSQHALLKFDILAAHGLRLEKELIKNAILNPTGFSTALGAEG